jgi:hypothetical protein
MTIVGQRALPNNCHRRCTPRRQSLATTARAQTIDRHTAAGAAALGMHPSLQLEVIYVQALIAIESQLTARTSHMLPVTHLHNDD